MPSTLADAIFAHHFLKKSLVSQNYDVKKAVHSFLNTFCGEVIDPNDYGLENEKTVIFYLITVNSLMFEILNKISDHLDYDLIEKIIFGITTYNTCILPVDYEEILGNKNRGDL